MHNGRAGKSGVFLASHNDRNFDTSKTEHIKKDLSENNWTWQRYQKTNPNMSFDDAEKKFYTEHFGKSLEAQNERHRQTRHLDRVKTIDEYRTGKQTCPEETILQIGKKGNTVPPALLRKLALEQINWEIKTFPNVKILDAAIHVDEEGAPHMHKRQVWTANGKDGLTVSQNKALKEMGIERPDKSKTENRWNNAKMSYTEQCRQHFIELCKKHGLDIEVEPKEASKSGLTLLEYQRQQEQETLERLKMSKEVEKRRQLLKEKELNNRQKDLDNREKGLDNREKDLDARRTSLNAQIRTFNKKHEEFNAEKEKVLAVANRAIDQQRENEAKSAELVKRQAELDKREKSFTNRQKRATEELKGIASYVSSMTAEQLVSIRKKMEKVEDASDFTDIVNALGTPTSSLEV
uniref:MobA/MobL protein domain-containing protein n=1 Tax=uncultured prokaryote TaxID=198431 RepID=A0A0H5Q6A7_9ZZZZ|nr:hypothetical protein [uncultured prokaryote]